jgi:hypothetical protein
VVGSNGRADAQRSEFRDLSSLVCENRESIHVGPTWHGGTPEVRVYMAKVGDEYEAEGASLKRQRER